MLTLSGDNLLLEGDTMCPAVLNKRSEEELVAHTQR